ncbi:MAG: OmpA family protein [Hyphomicrobiaceae bacterium]|nr:OmpA family protein [Hyphomicrobiaceae bacterium]
MSPNQRRSRLPGRFAPALPPSCLFAIAAAMGVGLPLFTVSPASANPHVAVLPTTSVEDVMRMRDAWGVAPSTAGATRPSPALVADSGYAVLPTTSVGELIKLRETWGKAGPVAQAANGHAVLPTTSVADLVKMREAWGAGKPVDTVIPPLATGTYSPLPQDKFELPEGPAGPPVVHALVPTPVPQMEPVPQKVIDGAMKALLAERSSWGPAPARKTTGAPGAYASLPTTSVADVVRMREAWGSAPSRVPVKATASAAEPAAEKARGSGGEKSLGDALSKLLAERASWGKAPSRVRSAAAPAATAVVAPTAAVSTDVGSCETRLRNVAMSGAILFDSRSSDLDSRSNVTLDALAEVAKACTKGRIRVGGHTDSTGRAANNKALSSRRAAAVADYLAKAGIPKDRIVAIGFGEESPLVSNSTPEGRAKNRRIEFTLID